jgi:hypothetical protein
MGKISLSSTNPSRTAQSSEETVLVPEYREVIVPTYVEKTKEVVVEVPKPVTKEVVVEIPKPVYKIVEVEEKVQKPKIKVEEVTQSVIKPVFTIKTETVVLDQLQKKLDETAALATSKLSALKSVIVQQHDEVETTKKELDSIKQDLKLIKTLAVLSVLSGLTAVLVSLLG